MNSNITRGGEAGPGRWGERQNTQGLSKRESVCDSSDGGTGQPPPLVRAAPPPAASPRQGVQAGVKGARQVADEQLGEQSPLSRAAASPGCPWTTQEIWESLRGGGRSEGCWEAWSP